MACPSAAPTTRRNVSDALARLGEYVGERGHAVPGAPNVCEGDGGCAHPPGAPRGVSRAREARHRGPVRAVRDGQLSAGGCPGDAGAFTNAGAPVGGVEVPTFAPT